MIFCLHLRNQINKVWNVPTRTFVDLFFHETNSLAFCFLYISSGSCKWKHFFTGIYTICILYVQFVKLQGRTQEEIALWFWYAQNTTAFFRSSQKWNKWNKKNVEKNVNVRRPIILRFKRASLRSQDYIGKCLIFSYPINSLFPFNFNPWSTWQD